MRSVIWIAVVVGVVGTLGCGDDDGSGDVDAGGSDAGRLDAGTPDGGTSCSDDTSCDDGVFCNGPERCGTTGRCVAGDAPVCDDGLDCTDDSCSEAARSCLNEAVDADGDGRTSGECGGDDCDDDDAMRFPGAMEACDPPGNRDEDCNPSTFGFRDADMDGEPDAQCCNGTNCGGDCDDARPGVNPAAPEVCNMRDDDCDGMTDEDVLVTYYRDADMDGHGDASPAAESVTGCARPAGFTDSRDDCNDAAGAIHPGVAEDCATSGVDDNCNGAADEGCDCITGMTYPCGTGLGRCAGARQACVAGRLGPCSVVPEPETCDTEDDDCDGRVDEGETVSCYADPDSDGYAASGSTATARCSCPAGQTTRAPGPGATDCAPTVGTRYPGAPEMCNRLDDDCSSGGGDDPTEDADMDMRAPIGAACSGGYLRDDCYDANAAAFPGQTAYFPTHRGDGSYDYDCNSVPEPQFTTTGTCASGGSCRCNGTEGYMAPPVACGDSQPYLERCDLGASCSCVPFARSRTQRCR